MNITPMKRKPEFTPHVCDLPPAGPRWLRGDTPRYPHDFIRCDDCGTVYKKAIGDFGYYWTRKRFGLKKLEVAS